MLHIIQNDPEVPPGNLIDNLVVPYRLHHPYRGDILPAARDCSALIVLGGAMGANDDQRHPFLVQVKKLIKDAIEQDIPYLGICLGGQLLAAVLGGKVVSNRWEELGTLSIALTKEGQTDRLFQGIQDEFATFQWHHDSFDIPDGALLLASSRDCPNQAFRVGQKAWGLQFHPEVNAGIIRDWCAWDREIAPVTEEFVTKFNEVAPDYQHTAATLLANFLASAGLSESPHPQSGK